MPINLDPARRFIERRILDDDITARTAAADVNATKTLNTTTGVLEDGPPAAEVWSGKAGVFPIGTGPAMPGVDEANLPVEVDADYKCLVAVSVTVLETGHILEVTKSVRDQELVGKHFRVQQESPVSTYSVCRILFLKRLD